LLLVIGLDYLGGDLTGFLKNPPEFCSPYMVSFNKRLCK
jgi:hypothetical protein